MTLFKANKRILLSLILIVCLLPAISGIASPRPNLTNEYLVKAAFTLNFARLTQWPDNKDTSSEQFTICVMGNETLKQTFSLVDGQNINGTISHLKIISRVRDIKSCQVLIVNAIQQRKMKQIFKSAHKLSILTISELPDISKSGAILNFINEGNKIKFQISIPRAKQSGLKISSRLLKLAQIRNGGEK